MACAAVLETEPRCLTWALVQSQSSSAACQIPSSAAAVPTCNNPISYSSLGAWFASRDHWMLMVSVASSPTRERLVGAPRGELLVVQSTKEENCDQPGACTPASCPPYRGALAARRKGKGRGKTGGKCARRTISKSTYPCNSRFRGRVRPKLNVVRRRRHQIINCDGVGSGGPQSKRPLSLRYSKRLIYMEREKRCGKH